MLNAGAGRLALAGGGALAVLGLIERASDDIDLFCSTQDPAEVEQLAERAIHALRGEGWSVTDMTPQNGLPGFRDLRAIASEGAEVVALQVCQDHISLPLIRSRLGPTIDGLELAANKVLAIYGRTAARDGDDLAHLVPRYGWNRIMFVADGKQVTPLSRPALAEQFERLSRRPASQFPNPRTALQVKQWLHATATRLDTDQAAPATTPYPMHPHQTREPDPDPGHRPEMDF